jgi:hypothetical protein
MLANGLTGDSAGGDGQFQRVTQQGPELRLLGDPDRDPERPGEVGELGGRRAGGVLMAGVQDVAEPALMRRLGGKCWLWWSSGRGGLLWLIGQGEPSLL